MIQLQADQWLHFEDLAQRIPGREDSLHLSEICYSYLAGRPSIAHLRAEAGTFDLKIRSALAAAYIQASVAPSAANLSSGRHESQSIIERQEATINRLLAFVPTRSGEVSEPRLQEVVREVAKAARESFGTAAPLSLIIERETDPDTAACHRIVVTVPTAQDADVGSLVDAEVAFRRELARSLSKLEFSAIRVLVEYEPV